MTAVAVRRAGYGLALAAALLFHFLDVGYLAWFLLWTVLALPLVSLLLALPVVLRCRGELFAQSSGAERGTALTFRAAVRYRGFLPLPQVRLRLRLTNEMTGERVSRKRTFSGLPDRRGLLGETVQWESAHCGYIRCEIERLQVVDGLGLFALPIPRPKPQAALVLPRLLDQLYISLGERLTGGGDRRRLLKAAALVKRLRGAAQLNANPGQMAGWLCAGMFLEHEKGGMQNAE